MRIAIIGATGCVGRELVKLCLSDYLPIHELSLFASSKSSRKYLQIEERKFWIDDLENFKARDYDYAIFSTPTDVSLKWIPKSSPYCVCIDLSQAYRKDPLVPLVIPEINGHLVLPSTSIIASPNCTTTLMLMPLFKLHAAFQLKRIILSTYQAASGGGDPLMQELLQGTLSYLSHTPKEPSLLNHPYAFNLFPHNSFVGDDDENEEEKKVLFETQKILGDASIKIHATCVRVPILRVHSLSVNAEFHHGFSLKEIKDLLQIAPGLKLVETPGHPMAHEAEGQFDVLCGRVRIDPTQKNTLSLWIVGDQLLKGAALNALQILKVHSELLIKSAKV